MLEKFRNCARRAICEHQNQNKKIIFFLIYCSCVAWVHWLVELGCCRAIHSIRFVSSLLVSPLFSLCLCLPRNCLPKLTNLYLEHRFVCCLLHAGAELKTAAAMLVAPPSPTKIHVTPLLKEDENYFDLLSCSIKSYRMLF